MFLCDKCAPKHGVSSVETLIYLRSTGECEECHRLESCMDVPFVAAQHLRALDAADASKKFRSVDQVYKHYIKGYSRKSPRK